MGIIQEELNNLAHEWNTHKIRPSFTECPPGIPDQLYFIPQMSGNDALLEMLVR